MGPRTHRTTAQRRWLKGSIFVAAGGSLAIASAISAVAGVQRTRAPQLAAHPVIGDRLAAVALVDLEMREDLDLAKNPRIAEVARRALAEQALNPAAARLLATYAATQKDEARAVTMMHLSERISRRDLQTQLMLIETAVSNGRVDTALTHYNRALTTKLSARALLFPVLRNATADPAILHALRPYIGARALWAEPFIRDSIAWGMPPARLVTLLAPADTPDRRGLSLTVSDQLIGYLVQRGDFRALKSYYLSLPGSSASVLTTLNFAGASIDSRRVPLAWATPQSGGIGVSFSEANAEGSGVAQISTPGGVRGVALRKLLYLTPGAYSWADTRQIILNSPGAQAAWELRCANQDARPALWTGPDGLAGTGTRARIVVPAGCPTQLLTLSVSGGDSQQGADFVVRKLSLTPAGDAGPASAN